MMMLTLPPTRTDRLNLPGSQDMKSLPYHGPAPRQFAVPAHTDSVAVMRNSDQALSYTQHLLRRKTPHGSVCDAYDATPTDRSIHMPATKHVLVSTSSPGSEQLTQSYSANVRSYFSENDDRNPIQTYEGVKSRDSLQNFGNSNRQEHRPSWDFPGGLDSVLNQALPLHPSQRYYLQYGSTVPTVLPATGQVHMGPTASARPELYGPYWPDGTFTPYRPAPVRDDRFYDGRVIRHPSHGSLQPSRGSHHAQDRYYSSAPLAGSYSPPIDGGFFLANSTTPVPVHPYSQVASFYDAGKNITLPSTQSYGFRQPGAPQVPYAQPNAWDADFCASRAVFQPTPESNHMAFRDKTFAWAHRIYVELLATVHQSRKLNHFQYKSNSNYRSASKPAIYPRPPKRSGSNFSALSNHERPSPYGARPSAHPQQRSTADNSLTHHETPRPPTAIYSPSRRGSDQLNGMWPDQNAASRLQSFSDHYNDKVRASRRTSDSAVEHYWTLQNPQSQYSNAAAALGMIVALCNESNGDWIDGMLLAGCLAYGLGEYDKALAWYQSILRLDPKHVEAMSNLAATLLALNRREEALSHWSTAVKLRPGYFEAVEHLIGLLCSDQRAKEAVAIIELVEKSLRIPSNGFGGHDSISDADSETKSRSSSINTVESLEKPHFDHDPEEFLINSLSSADQQMPGFGLGGFSIPGADNGRMLALIHAKGNMLYALGDNRGAAKAFEDAILVATGYRQHGIKGLIRKILTACFQDHRRGVMHGEEQVPQEPILLSPERALQTAKNMFYPSGVLPGLEFVAQGIAQKAAISTASNSLLSLAKIYQDGMSSATVPNRLRATAGTRDILALYYLSLSLQPSPSTANNVGILLASVQQYVPQRQLLEASNDQISNIPGVVPGSGIALALAYYNYGLNLDQNHAHLYTNLGSLLKDIGQLNAAIKMYELAVKCDGNFDIALANLANAVKDQGRVADAISYYRRAVQANPDFAEAVCGLATALNSVCGWHGRGGIFADQGRRDRIHVNERGMMYEGRRASGWVSRVVEIVEKQLKDGESYGIGTLTPAVIDSLCQQLTVASDVDNTRAIQHALQSWWGKNWEGPRIVRLVERAIRRIGWQWYQDRYRYRKDMPARRYTRPTLPASLTSPNAPTVLPFHTFTAPLSAKQIRQISQRNGIRISVSTLRSTWLPVTVYPPPAPPRPHLNVGYVSSDFNNHPLAHLMQSVFGMHDPQRVRAFCYATTASDGSIHRQQIEHEAPVFYDASAWSIEGLVQQIVKDGIHVLVNLNGYTRGARNEVFAARPAPIHMSFMGFAGSLGAEWCDYILADEISVPPEMLSPWRRNVDLEDRINPEAQAEDAEGWVYSENIIFAKDTFFCVDHKQSAPDALSGLGRPRSGDGRRERERLWEEEQERRWKLRKELFPNLRDDAVILGNFNQLYKIDPSTFRVYLRILAGVPNSILWLLRFPDLGEQNLRNFAIDWAGAEIASRIVFTDVAPKGTHITRASVVDLFLDTWECNAHTTAADVVWAGTPIITWGKWEYKMCSRMAGSILASALPLGGEGDEARAELLVRSEEQYEQQAIKLAQGLRYPLREDREERAGRGRGRLVELRRMLWEGRWTSRLFDTKRWVREVERAYWEAWGRWERGQGGDIWL